MNSVIQKCSIIIKAHVSRENQTTGSTRSVFDSCRFAFATVPMSRSSPQEWSPPAQWRPPVAPLCPPFIMPHPQPPRRPNQTGPTPTYRPHSRSLTTPTRWTTGTAAPQLFTFTSYLHLELRSYYNQMYIRDLVTAESHWSIRC